MADINNFAEITENFDTIKTLLNSIRAQGILNTSDVDKLLAGINSKLEKINTDEDIDLIKIFLSELKQNLDERHSVLISKFGAIESLFSNLLKNSADAMKTSEAKELFDIVATNLSVFSREVVSQKDTLNDITLRLDAMRSDDSQKKDIIKSIVPLKNDLERLNNGFDSIVLSLNENFKSLVKTLSTVDQSEAIGQFSKELEDILNSSNTVLSAIQMLDKKNTLLEDALKGLATQDDMVSAKKAITELTLANQEVSNSVTLLGDKYYKIDNLADKIDASVSIIAGLKTVLAESNEQNIQSILDELFKLENEIKEISSDTSFEEFKVSLESVLKQISDSTHGLQEVLIDSVGEIQKINTNLQALDINTSLQDLLTNLHKTELDVKSHVDMTADKVSQLVDVSVSRTLNEISSNAEVLGSRLKETHVALSNLCEKSFHEVVSDIAGLKSVVAQIDENNVSANNAIFSNITDRLAIFENSLKNSLEKQEDYVANSSNQVIEEITNLKNVSSVVDYKLDSSVIEINNAKKEFSELKDAVQNILALDFTNIVKDLRVDLYASKQELANAVESTSNDISDKLSNDLFSKYELLISKLDNVEDEIKKAQLASLNTLKSTLDNISASLLDVLSYVSETKNLGSDDIDIKLANITEIVKENNLNYVESVRDIVEVIRTQVENDLVQLSKETKNQITTINTTVNQNTEALKNEIKYSYNKILEIQDSFKELKNSLGQNNLTINSNLENILSGSDNIRQDFEVKLSALKNSLLESVADFKQEFTCENADKFSELKFVSENLHTKSIQNALDIKNDLRLELVSVLDNLKLNVNNLSEQISGSVLTIEGANKEIISYIKNEFCSVVDSSIETLKTNICDFSADMNERVTGVVDGFSTLESSVNNLASTTTSSLTSTLAQILDNFVAIKAVINSLGERNSSELDKSVDRIIDDFAKLRETIVTMDSNLDQDLTRQLSLIENNFDSITSMISELFTQNDKVLGEKLNAGLDEISTKVQYSINSRLEEYKISIENLFDSLTGKADSQAMFIKEQVLGLSSVLNSTLDKQNADTESRIQEIASNLKQILDENIELTSADYDSLKKNIEELALTLEAGNRDFAAQIKEQVQTIAPAFERFAASIEGANSQLSEELNYKIKSITPVINALSAKIEGDNSMLASEIKEQISTIEPIVQDFASKLEESNKEVASNLKAQIDDIVKFVDSNLNVQAQEVQTKFDEISGSVQEVSSNVIELNSQVKTRIDSINESIASLKDGMAATMSDRTELVISNLESLSDSLTSQNNEISSSILSGVLAFKNEIKTELTDKINNLSENFDNELVSASTRQIELIKDSAVEIKKHNEELTADKITVIQSLIEKSFSSQQNSLTAKTEDILNELQTIQGEITQQINLVNDLLNGSLRNDISELFDKIQKVLDENSLNYATSLENVNTKISNEFAARRIELKEFFEILNNRLDKDEVSQMNLFQSQLQELSDTFNSLMEDSKNVTKSEVSSISETLIKNSKELMEDVEQSIESKVNSILAASVDLSAGELQSMEGFAERILKQIETTKQNSDACKDAIAELVNKNLDITIENIEKETDVIVKDIIEQFELLRESQKDELSKMALHVESSIEDYIFNYVNELKSYMDIKTDSSILNHKLDSLINDLNKSVEDVLANVNKMLEANVFNSAISDIKTANEILISSMSEKLNSQIQDFVKENVTKKLEDRINLFDKTFVDTVVDKYEEIKLISSGYNNSFNSIQSAIQGLVEDFAQASDKITSLVDGINSSILELNNSFADLKAQILNKSFDEAFQASINNQISGIETLVNEQMSYIADISELCCNNLPELTEMNTLVKYGIQESIKNVEAKLENQDVVLDKELSTLKSDIITQFLNIFNQISFVAEQEEILDFIQDKHSELITILSHIVTTVDSVETVKENVAVVDNKIDEIKDDINLINEKITSIISADGDIDYVYSLHDLESDIANLRLILNNMKDSNKSSELEELIKSTNNVYKLVETIKEEMPKFELEEFKREFDTLAEDIVSISTRTNKLILASDDSYKTLQDNLQEFKLVINDLDERTRNFAHESGIDRIDDKLGSISSMIHHGTKTNQVFNEVFEYLAEWVDKAGEQITTISDKVETLDDIGQIKVMLEDLKAEAEDNTDSVELIEALGNVFDKQAKKIASLEAKLDRVIVETTISNKNNKIDMTPFENTLNRFLVAIDDKMSTHQSRIDSLESKLEEVMSKIDPKDTAQLTKKVGGMDRQIAKLNKSIEKIASHVVEK